LVFDGVKFTSPAFSAVLSGEEKVPDDLTAVDTENPVAFSSVSETTTSPITVSYSILRPPLSGDGADALVDNNFSILRYSVNGKYSAPISANDDNIYNITVPADNLYGQGKYSAAGKSVVLNLEWADLFGNTYNSAFVSDKILCGYKDGLISVDNFPLASSSFTVKYGVKDSYVQIMIDFADTKDLANTISMYQKICAQLNDTNVSAVFDCPCMGIQQPLNLAKWVKTEVIPKLLQNKTPKSFNASFEAKEYKGTDKLSEISASITITRISGAAYGYESVPNVKRVVSQTRIGGDILEFAKNYEKINQYEKVLKKDASLFRCKLGAVGIEKPEIYIIRPAFTSLYNSCDGNALLKNALRIIDEVFSPEIAGAAVLCEIPLDKLGGYKAVVANKLTEFLTPLGESTRRAREAAAETAKQRLLSKLSDFYSLKAVVSYAASTEISLENSRVYGSVSAVAQNALGLSFGTPKLNLYGEEKTLAFAVTGGETIRDRGGAVITGDDISISYGVSHIESEIRMVKDGYESSVWFECVNGNITNASGGDVTITFPLSFFPEQTQLTEQKQVISDEKKLNARYVFTYYNSFHYPQTTVTANVTYNGEASIRANSDNSLFEAVRAFDGNDNIGALKSLAEAVLSDQGSKDEFKASFNEMVVLVKNLSEASFAKIKTAALANAFTVHESDDNGRFCVTIESAEEVEPYFDGYDNECDDNHRVFFFTKTKGDDKEYLTSADGQAIKERVFKMKEQSVLDKKSANVTLFAVNNADMGGDFALATSPVSFPSPEKVSVVISAETALNEYGGTLNECLEKWFENVGNGACDVTVGVDCRARMKMKGNLPYSESPIFMQVPAPFAEYKELAASWGDAVSAWINSAPDLSLLKNKDLRILFDVKFCDESGASIVEVSNLVYAYSNPQFTEFLP
jgi:hypothetical protein